LGKVIRRTKPFSRQAFAPRQVSGNTALCIGFMLHTGDGEVAFYPAGWSRLHKDGGNGMNLV